MHGTLFLAHISLLRRSIWLGLLFLSQIPMPWSQIKKMTILILLKMMIWPKCGGNTCILFIKWACLPSSTSPNSLPWENQIFLTLLSCSRLLVWLGCTTHSIPFWLLWTIHWQSLFSVSSGGSILFSSSFGFLNNSLEVMIWMIKNPARKIKKPKWRKTKK